MNKIIQAISNHLAKHNIKHSIITDPQAPTWIRIYHRKYTTITHYTPDNTILITTHKQNQEIHPEDPQLFHKILQVLQT
jgi:hypothetical protein